MDNRIKTVIYLVLLNAILIAIGLFIGGIIGILVMFAIGMLLNFWSYWYAHKLVIAMYGGKPAPKDHKLRRIVAELAKKANLPMPKVYIINAPSPNAFATGRSPKYGVVAATDSLLQIMSEEEVKAVMAHELSHIKNRDTLIQTIAVGIGTVIALIANFFQYFAILAMGDDHPVAVIIGSLLIIILAPIIAALIQFAISRQREFGADEGAARIMGSAQPMISALQKLEGSVRGNFRSSAASSATESMFIVNPFGKKGGVSNLFSTHPRTEDRIAALKKLRI